MGQKQSMQESKGFSLLCWNIFGLDSTYVAERTHAICDFVREKKPDVVFFQEVVRSTWDILASELGRDYLMYRNSSVKSHYYHNLMVRKGSPVVPVETDITVEPFVGTGQGRHLLRIKTAFNNGTRINFMTSHLESLPTDRDERKTQLKRCFTIMRDLDKTSSETTVFGGDLNLADSELAEIGGPPQNVRDAWEVCGADANNELTWHTSHPTKRIDRIYYCPTNGRLQPVSFELVAKLDEVRKEQERLTVSVGRESHMQPQPCDPPKARHRGGCGPDDARPSTKNVRTYGNSADKFLLAVRVAYQLPDKERRTLTTLINRFAIEEKLACLRRESEVLRIQQQELESRERVMRWRRQQRRQAESHRDFEISRLEARAQRASAWEREETRKNQAQQLEERRATSRNKKQCQEERKHDLEWRDSLHRRKLAEEMMEVELKAMRKKDAQKKREGQQRLVKSAKERCQFSTRKAQLEEQKRQQQQPLKASIEKRLHRAASCAGCSKRRPAWECRAKEKTAHATETGAARELEADLKAWQKEVEDYLDECTLRGQAASERALEER
ncbi:hypothetical protein EMCRGX_G012486 [Ephydatia muelleri]